MKKDDKNSTHRSAKSICSSRQSSTSRDRKVSFRDGKIEEEKDEAQKIVEINNSKFLNDAEKTLEAKYNYMKTEYESYINELNKLNKTKTEECIQYKATIKNMFQDNSKLQVENIEYKNNCKEINLK